LVLANRNPTGLIARIHFSSPAPADDQVSPEPNQAHGEANVTSCDICR
jgi:hypothetical protein